MQRAGVEQGRRGATEAAALVEIVEREHAGFAVAFFAEEEAHGDAHPEELRGLEAAGFLTSLVDDEVAIVEGLHAEEVEIEVGGGVEGVGEALEVVVEELAVDALDVGTVGEVLLEGFLVELLQLAGAVGQDVPTEDFLVNVGELDTAGKLGEIGVLLDEGLRVEDDGLVEVLLGDLVEDGAEELHFDFLGGEAEGEADGAELDALFEVLTVPEFVGAVGLFDHDHGGLVGGSDVAKGGSITLVVVVGFVPVFVALGAIKNVGLGDFEVAGFHELLLHDVLDLFDMHKGLLGAENAGGDGFGDVDGGGGVLLQGEEAFAHGDLNLLVDVRDDLVGATDDADTGGGVAGAGGELAGAVEEEALGNVVGGVVDEGLLDELVEVVEGDLEVGVLEGLCGEVGGDFLDDGADEALGFGGEDISLLAAGEVDVGHGVADGLGNLAQVEFTFAGGGQQLDRREQGSVTRNTFTPSVRWTVRKGRVGGGFEREVVSEGRIHFCRNAEKLKTEMLTRLRPQRS